MTEQNLYLRSDVSGPLDLSNTNNLDQHQQQQIYYAAAAQTKLGHMLMNNYSQMQPPPYPISYNPAQIIGCEESKVSSNFNLKILYTNYLLIVTDV